MKKLFTIFLAVAFILAIGSSALADTIANAGAVADANTIVDINGAEANTRSRANAEQSVSFNQNFEGSKIPRGFVTQGEYNVIPGFNVYSGPDSPDHKFRYVSELLEYQKAYTVAGLIELVSPETLKAYQDKYGQINGLDKVKDVVHFFVRTVKKNGNGEIEVSKYKPKGKLQQRAFITVASVKGLTSVECLGLIGLLAHEKKGNVAVITRQGVKRTSKSFTWGVGIAYTGSAMSGDGNRGDTRGGGTGVASAKGGYVDDPYQSATVLHDDGLKYKS